MESSPRANDEIGRFAAHFPGFPERIDRRPFKPARNSYKRAGKLFRPIIPCSPSWQTAGFAVLVAKFHGTLTQRPGETATIFMSAPFSRRATPHTSRDVPMRSSTLTLVHTLVALLAAVALGGPAWGQTDNYFGTSGVLNGNVWSTNAAGPYTSALDVQNGARINFGNVATFDGGSITVAGINATASATLGTSGGTITNLSNGVISINVSAGVTLDFAGQSFTGSASAGYIKNGSGVLILAGGNYGGGFTLNSGTVIARGVNALGGGAGNTLVLNGGILAGNVSNRDLSDKYAGGITIGGNVQFGDIVGSASTSGNLTFNNNMSLGAAARTLTLGNTGTNTFNGIISNSVAAGNTAITFAANANANANSAFVLGGANTYTGDTVISGGTLQLSVGANRLPTGTTVSLGQASGTGLGTLNLNGQNQQIAGLNSLAGTNATANKNTVTSGTAATLTLGGSGTYSYGAGTNANSGIITGAVSVVKSGSGMQTFGDANTYTGTTSITGGVLMVTNSASTSATGTGAVTVGTGTILAGGTGSGSSGGITGAISVSTGSVIRADGGAGTNTLNARNVTLAGGAVLRTNVGATGSNSTLNLAGVGSSVLTFNSDTGNRSIVRVNDLGTFTRTSAGTWNLATEVATFQFSDLEAITSGTILGTFTSTGGFAGTSTGRVVVDLATSPEGFTTSLTAGDTFTLSRSGGNLVLTFQPVPEPATVLAIGAAGLGLAGWVRRRRQKAATATA